MLVHFCARSNTIDGHVENFTGADDIEKAVDALEDGNHHLVFILGSWLILGMSTRMDDSVHIQVQIVKLHSVGVRLGGVDFCIVISITNDNGNKDNNSNCKNILMQLKFIEEVETTFGGIPVRESTGGNPWMVENIPRTLDPSH